MKIKKGILSFSIANSLLRKKTIVPTFIAFAINFSISAAEFDSINTCVINFQDVLIQKKLPYRAFWCDKNVDRIAKELQLLFNPKVDNLFIGIAGFHTEKVFWKCCGLYLKDRIFLC